MIPYEQFLQNKIRMAQRTGFVLEDKDINQGLKPHNRLMVQWLVNGGRRACFASFGLHKTVTQLETVRCTLLKTGGRGLIIAPLGVRAEFKRDAINILKWPVPPKFIRRIEEADETGIYITNYETVRDGKLDPRLFNVASLDEASILRGFGGSKTFREFMRLFTGDAGPNGNRRGTECVPYRFVATATPSPNDYIELLAYADFLGIMDVSQAKAQPLDAKILTPAGWKLMGEIKVGSNVISVDGMPTKVLGVYPQGMRPIYKVSFSDGSSTECDADHLWLTKNSYERNNERKYLRGTGRKTKAHNRKSDQFSTVKTTLQIATSIKDIQDGYNHLIPTVAPVQFPAKEIKIAPYFLGALLGDGYLRKVNVLFSSADKWILDRVKEAIPTGLELYKTPGKYDYSIRNPKGRGTRNVLVQHLRSYGLNGKRSFEKHIPTEYLFNTVSVRLEVLRGLMDTDGTVDKVTGCMYCTTSHQLAKDVQFIVQSLGGVARIRETKTAKRNAFILKITLPEDLNPFSIPRKADKVTPKSKHGLRRFITSVELVGKKEAQCIAVADNNHLYVTDDFIVTHNTRFFKRDSTQADKLTLHAHKEEEFWLWVASWALFVQKPSDLTGNPEDDLGYMLPPLDVKWHELPSDHSTAGVEKSGQRRMFKKISVGISDSAKEKRESLHARVNKIEACLPEYGSRQSIIWCDLNAEQLAVEQMLKRSRISYVSLYGSEDIEAREEMILRWKNKEVDVFVSKASMYGSGINMQQCDLMFFIGIGYKFNQFIQAIHRIYRFGQVGTCHINILHTEAERDIRKQLERKWSQHNKMVDKMTDIMQKFGLSQVAMANLLTRKIGVERIEIKGDKFSIVNNDAVLEARRLQENSVGLIFTSIPFSTQYEYSPNYSDFGHSENNDEFFQQMDYLTPELFRSLQPGRIAAIHVKDRIVPGGMTGLGFQTVYPFHIKTHNHYTKHGFQYLGMKTIVTDVVRENNQTYRLGWTEQCKDGSKMGVGMPEYLLLFRKPPSDTSNAYADVPVVKSKEDYTLSKWQVDAHGYTRSSGNRLLNADELVSLPHDKIFKIFREHSLNAIYDFDFHVEIGEKLAASGKLPTTFMLLQPQSWSNEVWTDITRMRTLNGSQWSKGKEMHLCPMQLDLATRVITQFSNEGDTVLDPFGGLMTVPSEAVKLNRIGKAFELNHNYFLDGAAYCAAAERTVKMPTLFDLLNEQSLTA